MDRHDHVLVTGGAGFIGSHLSQTLSTMGYDVTIIDNLSSGKQANIDEFFNKINFVLGDILDVELLSSIIAKVGTIFHLAAAPDVRESGIDPERSWSINVEGTRAILEALRRNKTTPDFLFFSSSTVYGESTEIPIPESYGPLEPISVYGASKLAAEALVSSYANSYGFKSASLRLANIVGSRSSHGIIHDLIVKLHRDRTRLEVLGDGKQTKSYLHVSDCVGASLKVWHSLRDPYDVFNVGSADNVAVDDIVKIAMEETNSSDTQIVHVPSGPRGTGWVGDVKNMQLDIAKLKALGWSPTTNSSECVRIALREAIIQFNKNCRHAPNKT